MDSEPRTVWRMRSGLLISWTLLIIVTAVLGFIGFILLQRNLSWQTPPDLTQVVFGGGLALLGTGVVVGLWIWVLRVTLVSRRYGDTELELTNGKKGDRSVFGKAKREPKRDLSDLSPFFLPEARWLVAELSRALHQPA